VGTRHTRRDSARADAARTASHSDRSSKPGGLAPVAACHAAAALRWAIRRDTAAPTANETDHTSASRHRTPRDAGFAGGSSCRLARQTAVIPQRKAAAAAAPDANATTSHIRRRTPISFPARTLHNRTLPPDRSLRKLCAPRRIVALSCGFTINTRSGELRDHQKGYRHPSYSMTRTDNEVCARYWKKRRPERRPIWGVASLSSRQPDRHIWSARRVRL
jgi:hypothetical protein